MAEFRRAGDEQVNVFIVDGLVLFKHYFEAERAFDRLKQYYNHEEYRFEVPAEDFTGIRSFLQECGYGLVVIDVPESFVVVVKKYTRHPENIFKESVARRTVDGYTCFLMVDQSAVDRAVQNGAIRLTDTDFESPF